MREALPTLILAAGIGQLSILTASALVPIRLNWRRDLAVLSHLHRQMYWVYGGYVVLSIVAFGVISLVNAHELASGTRLARSMCAYIAVFWAIRLSLQPVLDVKEHLKTWWLAAGYRLLTVLFACFVTVYTLAAVLP